MKKSFWILFGLWAALAGCFRRPLVKGPGDPSWGVQVDWRGHSCFLLRDSTERTFLTDPFDETVGYEPVWAAPDAVLVTHEHFDHDHLRRAVAYELVNSTGVHTVAGVEVTGVLGFHDDQAGRRHGTTRFYAWEMGGVRLAHLGDVGQTELTEDQKRALGPVDVLFVPVGGKTTVDAEGAAALVRQLNPRIVVPMHYGNERVRFFEFDPVDPFLKLFRNVKRLPGPDFQVKPEDLPPETTVYAPAVPGAQKKQ